MNNPCKEVEPLELSDEIVQREKAGTWLAIQDGKVIDRDFDLEALEIRSYKLAFKNQFNINASKSQVTIMSV